jgi:hypothetical protein
MFGIDYYTRTAVAKSNILVNKPIETKYFYQDLDSSGVRLNGKNSYTVTFAKGQVPPVKGFWSLTLYNEHHFFHPNELKRYSLGTKNKTLQYGADGSLTIYVGAKPPDAAQHSNWLQSPEGEFSLYIRAYWPDAAIIDGTWRCRARVSVSVHRGRSLATPSANECGLTFERNVDSAAERRLAEVRKVRAWTNVATNPRSRRQFERSRTLRGGRDRPVEAYRRTSPST